MSFMSGLFSGEKGANWQGTSADITKPVGYDQAQGGINSSNAGLQQYAQFLNALKGQHGLQNQSQVYNQLQGVANGTGPNPAQAMLNQATGQNVANQAALMAGQRGSSANAGLIARQAAQQGANLQQQAVGQGATMQANQSLNALGQAGNMANQQASQYGNAQATNNNLLQSQEGQLLGSIANQNSAIVGNQGNLNNVNSGIAKGNQGFQAGQVSGLEKSIGSALNLASGGQVPHYDDGGPIMGMPAPSNSMSMPGIGQSAGFTPITPIAPGGAPAGAASNGPKSPIEQHFSSSGPTDADNSIASASFEGASALGSALMGGPIKSLMGSVTGKGGDSGGGGGPASMMSGMMGGGGDSGGGGGMMSMLPMAAMMLAAHGGRVPALVSPGEKYLPPKEVKKVAEGKKPAIKAGETIKGKAKVKGDSYANDTVHKTLQEGGIVLPRSVTQAKNAPEAASKFVAAIIAKNGLKRK